MSRNVDHFVPFTAPPAPRRDPSRAHLTTSSIEHLQGRSRALQTALGLRSPLETPQFNDNAQPATESMHARIQHAAARSAVHPPQHHHDTRQATRTQQQHTVTLTDADVRDELVRIADAMHYSPPDRYTQAQAVTQISSLLHQMSSRDI